MFKKNFPYFSMCPLPSVFSLGTTEKRVWFHLLYVFPSGIYISGKDAPEPPDLQVEQACLPQPLII